MLILKLVALFGICIPAYSQGYTDKIPIGAIFNKSTDNSTMGFPTATAFQYKITVHNDNKGPIQLQAVVHQVRIKDVFAVTTSICDLLRNGVFAIFGTHNSETINAIMSFTRTFHMPFITPSMAVNVTGQEKRFEVYMRPLYSRAILDIIKHYHWSDIYYIYDSEEGLLRLQQLFDILAEDGYLLRISVHQVDDENNVVQILNNLNTHNDEEKRILLDLPTAACEELFEIQQTDTRRVKYHYLLVGLGVNELNLHGYRNGGLNMTGFRLVDFNNETVVRFITGWKVMAHVNEIEVGKNKLSYEAALAVDAVELIVRSLAKMKRKDPFIIDRILRDGKVFNNGSEGIDCEAEPPVPWMLGKELIKTIRSMEFYGLTGRVAFDKFGLRKKYNLDILEVNFNRGLAKIGTWYHSKGLEIHSPSLVRAKGNNTIANKTRIVTSIIGAPYMVTKPDFEEREGNDRFEGYCVDLAKKIAAIVGFDYRIEIVKDGRYGSRDENGSWDGMVGELVSKRLDMFLAPLSLTSARVLKSDLVIAPLTITSAREYVIDFSKPFMSLGISIMIKKPTKQTPGVFSFMYPLSYEIWMCVVFAYIGVSVVLFLVSRFSPFEWHIEDSNEGPSVTNNFTIFNSLWFSLGAFMQQGCDIEPRSRSGRIVGSVWWFFTLIIISSYTANLAAFLTVERMQSPIESADDLAKQTEIKYGTVDGGSTMEFFKTSTIPVYERMWAFMSSAEPPVFMSSNDAGSRKVRQSNGKYAFLTESTTNDYTNERQPCDTMKVGSNLDSKGYGIGTPLGSDLRDRVTLAVLELREKGELQKLEKKWWYEKGECTKGGSPTGKSNRKDATNALKILNVAGIFYILVGGLVLALITAFFEFLYKSRVEARRRKTSFTTAVRSKARLSIKGKPERQTPAVGSVELPPNMSMSTYTYAPAAQLISLDGYAETNTHTQV